MLKKPKVKHGVSPCHPDTARNSLSRLFRESSPAENGARGMRLSTHGVNPCHPFSFGERGRGMRPPTHAVSPCHPDIARNSLSRLFRESSPAEKGLGDEVALLAMP